MEYLKTSMSKKLKRPLQQSGETDISNWLIMLQFANYGFKSSKQHVWDSIKLRYSCVTSKLPRTCLCGRRFDVQHSMICTKIEAKPVSLSGEGLNKITANQSNEVKLNIRAPSFWKREQQAFFLI